MQTNSIEIIAEIAQAHDGSIGILHSYIDTLAACGVDTVKFQMHIADAESSEFEEFRIPFSYIDKTRMEYWKRMEISFENWQEIKNHCADKNVNFLCSPFSIKALKQLKELNCNRIKIASGEVNNYLMHHFAGLNFEEILISSGLSTWEDLEKVVNYYKKIHKKITVFQCTTQYPTPPENWGLNILEKIHNEFQIDSGYSDHSSSIAASMSAVALGAKKVEFHAVWDKNMFGPDAKSSLTMSEIKQLVLHIREIEIAKQNPINKNSSEKIIELKNMFGKSLAVNKNLHAGSIISWNDLESKKPAGKGISAEFAESIIGKKINNNLIENQFINESDFE